MTKPELKPETTEAIRRAHQLYLKAANAATSPGFRSYVDRRTKIRDLMERATAQLLYAEQSEYEWHNS